MDYFAAYISTRIAKLQLVQNAAAKVICGLRKFNYLTPSLYNLHLLPFEQRIIFKILLLVYKARSGEGSKYLKDLLLPYSAHHKGLTVQLRSSDDPTLLDTPSTDKITYGDRSFSYAGTYYWNKLPQVICELDTLLNLFTLEVKRREKIKIRSQNEKLHFLFQV